MTKHFAILSINVIFASFGWADHAALSDKARDVARLLFDKERDLSVEQAKDVENHLDEIVRVIQEGSKMGLLCVESTSRPGQFCFKTLTGDNTCMGNFFSTMDSCRSSLKSVRRGYACFESRKIMGKAIVAKVESNVSGIGNYFSSMNNCTDAMSGSRDLLVCMESERHAGKWHVGKLDSNGDMVGPYLASLEDCNKALKNP